MLKTILLVAALTSASFGQKNAAMAPVTDIEGLPRVLLIGDSISIGYTVGVRKSLQGKANVHRPTTNCGPTTKGLKGIDTWLNTGGKDKKWDVIHFNVGLHDLKYLSEGKLDKANGKQVSSTETYKKNLGEIVTYLKKLAPKAKLIFDDLKSNAVLTASLAYLASEDPEFTDRTRRTVITGRGGQPAQWPTCSPARRSSPNSTRM